MMLLISFSLNPNSKSYKAIKYAGNYLKSIDSDFKFIDMREYELPFYNGIDNVLHNDRVKELFNIFNKVEKIIIATPVYNFDVNAVLKNFIDWLSVIRYKNKLLHRQVVGIIGAMGSEKSFTSLLPSLTNFQFSLGFYLLPKIVMCVPMDFIEEGNKVNINLENRIKSLCDTMLSCVIN